MSFAANTLVSPERSRLDIERLVIRHGATAFTSEWDQEGSVIGFRLKDRQIRFHLPLPRPEAFGQTPGGKPRDRRAQESVHGQAVRQRWRALLLCIKAKLEAVEAGITTLEEEFLAHIVVPGQDATVGELLVPQLRGKGPIALPSHSQA